MDGCKLIIEYEVDCTFKYPDEDTDKSGPKEDTDIVVHDKENETSKGKIRYSSPDIYFEYTAYSDSNLLSNTGKGVLKKTLVRSSWSFNAVIIECVDSRISRYQK